MSVWPEGRTIVRIDNIEHWQNRIVKDNGWETCGSAVVLVLDDGSRIYPSKDEECNGPGVLLGITPDDENVYLTQTF